MQEISVSNVSPFYLKVKTYWSDIPPTVDGMLGTFGHLSEPDIQCSEQFLKSLFKLKVAPGKVRAIDCGAGIGRITKNLLVKFFEKVDLVEQNPKFIEEAASYVGPMKNLGIMYCTGLQDFKPDPNTYDVVWCQWVLGHLSDEDIICFFINCKLSLKRGGIIVVKENVTSSHKEETDPEDSSVTRSLAALITLFQKANLRCVRNSNQTNFPKALYPVKMFALRPA